MMAGSGMGGIRFETADGVALEGELRLPEGSPAAVAVLCHAHPRHGGSKDHPLLWAIRIALVARRFAVLTFNFRGIMGSAGTHGGGEAETADVRAAVGRVREVLGTGPTLVCGWSFGAHVALRTAVQDGRIDALALIGLPLAESSLAFPDLPAREVLKQFDRPVLLVSGEADQFSPSPEIRTLAGRLPRSTLRVVAGTDHFFWKREREVAEAVGEFVESALGLNL